jgi:hypothetical protein
VVHEIGHYFGLGGDLPLFSRRALFSLARRITDAASVTDLRVGDQAVPLAT